MPKFLCLTSHDLDGPEYGAMLRARNVFRLLSRIGEVRVVLANSQVADAGKTSTVGFELAGVMPFYETGRTSFANRLRHEFDGKYLNTECQQASAADRQKLESLMAAHDLVWIHGVKIANGFGLWRWPKSVLDIDDIPSSFHRSDMASASGMVQRLKRYRQMRLWQRREKYIRERFDALCVCSPDDFKELGGGQGIFVVPNGFNPPDKLVPRQLSISPRIGFVGAFQYRPNREGVDWFVQKVWPQILQAQPSARLRLIGKGSEDCHWPEAQNIDRLGFVSNVAEEMATWSLSVVPVFVGGGTRIKIAEAFSRRCPVVSTTLGAHGYGAVDGRELLLADDPKDFSKKCLRILSDARAGEGLADHGWQRFMESWTWDSFAGRVQSTVDFVLKKTSVRG